MIGKGNRALHRRAGAGKRVEELLRPADAGKGEQRVFPPFAKPDGLQPRTEHLPAGTRRGADQRLGALAVADQHQRVGPAELDGERCPQRARRRHHAVADADRTVDADQRQVLGQRRVLETVVHDDQVDALRQEELGPRDPVGTHHGRRRRGEQHRLVPDVGRGVARRIDPKRPFGRAAIAARHVSRLEAASPGDAGERDRGRRLAGAADDEIADADHRHRRPELRRPHHPPRRRLAVDLRDRPEHQRRAAPLRPPPEPWCAAQGADAARLPARSGGGPRYGCSAVQVAVSAPVNGASAARAAATR